MSDSDPISAAGGLPSEPSFSLRHLGITGGFVAVLGTMIYTTSDRLIEFNRNSDHVQRREVVGTVEYQGRPLERGTIRFRCQIIESHLEFTDAEGPVRNGAFCIPRHLGPVPGLYLMSVTPDEGRVANFVAPNFTYGAQDSSVIRASIDSPVLVSIESRRVNRFDLRLH